MTASRERLWRYVLRCDEPGCAMATAFTTGGQPADPEWLRISEGPATDGWTWDLDDHDYCPEHRRYPG
jgi:hypothetical protein